MRIIALSCLLLSACSNMTLNQKRALAIGVTVLAVGAAAAHGHGDNRPAANGGAIGQPPSCHPQPDGTCR